MSLGHFGNNFHKFVIMNRNWLYIVCVFVILGSFGRAFSHPSDTLKLDSVPMVLKNDPPHLMVMDSLWVHEQLSAQHMLTDTFMLNIHEYAADSIPLFSDSIIQQRLADLDELTPFNLTFNAAVKRQINIYANVYRKHVSSMLGKSNYYFPLFEPILDRYDLPLEFKYLAIVESALKPHARSRSAATGLWQFMYNTGKIYDLKVTSYVDERSDPLQSTIAACEYFTFLHSMFNDWELVLAAYNGGPGYVSRKMRKHNVNDYWSLRPFLRKETQQYVPKFIAVNYIMNHASDHNIFPTPYPYTQAQTDTITIHQSIPFEVLSKILDVDMEVLQELNPMYKRNLLSVTKQSKSILKLPSKKMALFIHNMDSIYAHSLKHQTAIVTIDEPIIYYVKKGDYLGKIAKAHRTTVGRLKNWNNLSSSQLKIGQKLVIYTNPDDAPNSQAEQTIHSNGQLLYTVKAGDTLWDIARKYSGVTVSQLEKVNNITHRELKPGLRLKIPKSG